MPKYETLHIIKKKYSIPFHFSRIIFFVGTVYFQCGRKNPKIVVDQYAFYYQKKRDNTTYWYCCSNGQKKCKARVITSGKMVRVIGFHNHCPKEIKKFLLEPQEAIIVRYTGKMC